MLNGGSIISMYNYFKSIAQTKMGYRMAAILKCHSKMLHELENSRHFHDFAFRFCIIQKLNLKTLTHANFSSPEM